MSQAEKTPCIVRSQPSYSPLYEVLPEEVLPDGVDDVGDVENDGGLQDDVYVGAQLVRDGVLQEVHGEAHHDRDGGAGVQDEVCVRVQHDGGGLQDDAYEGAQLDGQGGVLQDVHGEAHHDRDGGVGLQDDGDAGMIFGGRDTNIKGNKRMREEERRTEIFLETMGRSGQESGATPLKSCNKMFEINEAGSGMFKNKGYYRESTSIGVKEIIRRFEDIRSA